MNKLYRLSLAIFMAFGSLFFATPAKADVQTLEQAQIALSLGQQELTNATLYKFDADALVISASQDVIDAENNLALAQAAYDSSRTDYPATTTSGTQNVVVNGTFDDASAWSGITMYQDSMYNNFGSAVVRAGALWGSYSSGNFYYQQGTFASPVRTVTFAVDVWDNANQRQNTQYDYYRIEFRTYSASGARLNYYNLEYSGAFHDWMTRTATYNLSADAVRWDVGFRLADGGYWNGNYGPAVDNVKVMATTSVTVPAYSTYGQAETAALAAAQSALETARTAYAAALATQAQAAARLQAASDAIPTLESAIIALTPITPPWWAQQNNEGDTVTITAPQGWEFYSVRAWYGSPDDWNCGTDVSSILGSLMIGQTSITVGLDNGTFGDPCGGVYKVTRLTWSIIPITIQPQPEPEIVVPPVVDPPVIEPQPQPQPIPFPVEPTPTPTETPVIIVPVPTPTEEPIVEPTPAPTVEPSPTPTPTEEPTPAPTQSQEPAPKPTENVIQPLPEPKPTATPEVQPKPELSIKEAVAAIAELADISPEKLTDNQTSELKDAAITVLDTAVQGSPEYAQALEALAVVAQADDPELPAELAAIPGAAAVLDALNALGNIGADMSPKQREESKKIVVSAIVVGQVAQMATAAAASAAAASSSGSSGPRRRK